MLLLFRKNKKKDSKIGKNRKNEKKMRGNEGRMSVWLVKPFDF
jgi:hypothetical protein